MKKLIILLLILSIFLLSGCNEEQAIYCKNLKIYNGDNNQIAHFSAGGTNNVSQYRTELLERCVSHKDDFIKGNAQNGMVYLNCENVNQIICYYGDENE